MSADDRNRWVIEEDKSSIPLVRDWHRQQAIARYQNVSASSGSSEENRCHILIVDDRADGRDILVGILLPILQLVRELKLEAIEELLQQYLVKEHLHV